MKLFILPILIFFCACDEKPTTYTETVVGRGLWMTTRTGSSGRLVRLDRDNLKETKIGHNQIFSDAVLIPRPNSGIFMLTRMGSDSIQIFDGEYGHLSAEIALPAGDLSDGYIVPYNPQFALLDNSNQVWVVGQNSNTIHVFDINNNKLINSIALDDNKSDFFIKNDGSDHYLEPAIIVAPNEDEIVVIAQRLRRYYNGGWDWVPAEESAMVVIDKDSLSIKTIQYLPISNPIKAFVDSSHSWPIITVIGAGSLNNHPINGSIAQISSKDYSVIDEKFFPFKILDADANSEGKLAIIAWYKDKGYSCIHLDNIEITCRRGEQGYIFNKIALGEEQIFVSINDQGSGFLMTINSNKSIKTIPTRGLIESMVLGL